MKFFMVFASRYSMPPGYVNIGNPASRPQTLQWDAGAIGVFRAETADLACKAAARKHGSVGTFFAIEGYPWGLEMQHVDGVDELGVDDLFAKPTPQLEGRADARVIRELERELLDDPDTAVD